MDQFDTARKLLAGNHPEAFLRLFAPDLAVRIDWAKQYCLPDHELLPPAADCASAARRPDILLLATLLDGSQACLHIEIQCSRDENFAERMAIDRSRLHDRFAMPILSIALLADASPRWRPDKYEDERDGCGMTAWKTEASMNINELYESDKHADKNSFAYVMWETTDKRGRMKGRAEGRAEGRDEAQSEARRYLAALLERQLTTRFGRLPAAVRGTLRNASDAQLDQLALALLRVRTLDDALAIAGLIA